MMSDSTFDAPPISDFTADALGRLERLHAERKREIDERFQRSQLRLLVMFVFFMTLAGVAHWYSLQASPSLVNIRNIRPSSPTNLCPGDILTYSYDLVGGEPVAVEITTTIWRVTPPQTVVYGSSRLDILIPPISHVGGESFIVPSVVFDPTTPNLVEITSGRYARRVAVTAVGRDTKVATAELPFLVREDCNHE